ncbi:hypothetical protein [Natronococcus wangiae]|uniref:hypothetical protein n=1 Tax=Natronococcus wangiae TaxID=3068275 RepID=UPI00273D345D|nr:hypothetical protein [Natronococcus sp. AD5]
MEPSTFDDDSEQAAENAVRFEFLEAKVEELRAALEETGSDRSREPTERLEKKTEAAARLETVLEEIESGVARVDEIAGQVTALESAISDLAGGGAAPAPDGKVVASERGFDGDGSGGDVGAFVRENLGKEIHLDGDVYRLQSSIDVEPGDADLVITGGGRLRVDHEDVDAAFRLGNWGEGISTCVLEGLEIDLDGYDAGIGRFFVDDYLHNSDLVLRGRRDHYERRGDKYCYLSCITSPTGVGYNERIRIPDGDRWAGDNDNGHAIGIASDPPHVGTQLWIDCFVREIWDNGFYIRNSPDGTNVLVSPRAENCGRANVRLGARDVAIEPTSVWDMDPDSAHFPIADDDGVGGWGTLLASDGDGAMIVGGEAISRTGRNDVVRTWGGSGRFTMIGTEIVNETDQWSIRTGVGSGGDDDRIARFEGVTIREDSSASVRGAAVCSRRSRALFDSLSYVNEGDTQSRAFLEVDDDCSATVRDSHVESASDSVVRLRSSPDEIAFDGCELNGGIDIGEGETIDVLELDQCDMRECGEFWTGDGDASAIEHFPYDSSPEALAE